MIPSRVAILGGDRRELRIAERLMADGHLVAMFGNDGQSAMPVAWASSAEQAVDEARWIVCPSPGLGSGDRVYAPNADVPIVLDRALLGRSMASAGGLVLGRATPTVTSVAAELRIRVFEMKDDRSLAIANATAVAEGILQLLIGVTDRILADHHILILGYGATGAALLDRLVALGCRVQVAARRPEMLERIRQCGGTPVDFPDRLSALASANVVINTVPTTEALPTDAFPLLDQHIVIDIASPPGGLDHQTAQSAGVTVTWARGLAGGRAPITAGDAQYGFLTRAMTAVATLPPPTLPSEPPGMPLAPAARASSTT